MPSVEAVWKFIFRIMLGKKSPVLPDVLDALECNPVIQLYQTRWRRKQPVNWRLIAWGLGGCAAAFPLCLWIINPANLLFDLNSGGVIILIAYLTISPILCLELFHRRQKIQQSRQIEHIMVTPWGGFRCALGELCVHLTGPSCSIAVIWVLLTLTSVLAICTDPSAIALLILGISVTCPIGMFMALLGLAMMALVTKSSIKIWQVTGGLWMIIFIYAWCDLPMFGGTMWPGLFHFMFMFTFVGLISLLSLMTKRQRSAQEFIKLFEATENNTPA